MALGSELLSLTDAKSGEVAIVGLSDHLRANTGATWEAFQLALGDGFLTLYGDADTAHRTYGCSTALNSTVRVRRSRSFRRQLGSGQHFTNYIQR
jgi:hypothetical protein